LALYNGVTSESKVLEAERKGPLLFRTYWLALWSTATGAGGDRCTFWFCRLLLLVVAAAVDSVVQNSFRAMLLEDASMEDMEGMEADHGT